MGCFDECEQEEKQRFIAYMWRPMDWSMRIYTFFNKRCYFDFIYNYYIVTPVVLTSIEMRIALERGIFLYLADQVVAFSKRLGGFSGYSLPKGLLENLYYAIAIFTVL